MPIVSTSFTIKVKFKWYRRLWYWLKTKLKLGKFTAYVYSSKQGNVENQTKTR